MHWSYHSLAIRHQYELHQSPWHRTRYFSSYPSVLYMHRWTRSALVQAITWSSADLLSIGPFGTNFSEIRIETQHFSFVKMHLNISSTKWRPFYQGGGGGGGKKNCTIQTIVGVSKKGVAYVWATTFSHHFQYSYEAIRGIRFDFHFCHCRLPLSRSATLYWNTKCTFFRNISRNLIHSGIPVNSLKPKQFADILQTTFQTHCL